MTYKNKRKSGRLLRRVIPWLVVFVVLSPFIVYAVPEVVGADQSYIVLSGSMEPEISAGDVVVVGSVSTDEIAVGDIITFQRSATAPAVTHRVIDVADTENGIAFQTKGDANEDADPAYVASQQVVGKVFLTIPYLGFVIQFTGSPTGFVALVVIPFGLLALLELWSFATAKDETPTQTAAPAVLVDEPPAFETDADEGFDFTFSKTDLTLTSVVLVVFAAYAGYNAYVEVTVLSIMIAVGVSTAALLTIGLRQFGLGAVPLHPTATDGGVTARETPALPGRVATPEEIAWFEETGFLSGEPQEQFGVPSVDSSVGSSAGGRSLHPLPFEPNPGDPPTSAEPYEPAFDRFDQDVKP